MVMTNKHGRQGKIRGRVRKSCLIHYIRTHFREMLFGIKLLKIHTWCWIWRSWDGRPAHGTIMEDDRHVILNDYRVLISFFFSKILNCNSLPLVSIHIHKIHQIIVSFTHTTSAICKMAPRLSVFLIFRFWSQKMQ